MTGVLYQVRKNIPADQLFLHIDRNLYHVRDTIRFQAYIRNNPTGVFETKSCALYALLLNSDHVTIDSARFRIINSTASGWLTVPEAIPPGDYSILAFTSSNMNYSPEFAFTTPIKIDNLRSSQNVTKTESKDKVQDNNPSLHQGALPRSTTDLTFLPEGGTFIYGIKQRLAFNAVTSTGKTREVSGVITNQKGEEITRFTSTQYGPGVVELTPVSGDYYFATVKGEEFKGLKWPLPVPEKSGAAMRVNKTGNGLIDIILRGREISGMPCFLTITMNNVLVFTKDVRLDTLFRESIPTDKLPSGTAFITLYDHELNPIAERLIFLNDYKKMNVEIGVSSPIVNRGDETELTVGTTDDKGNNISSIVSIAVIDSASGYHTGIPIPEIESVYLYDREFYNNLPSRIKSRGLKNIDSKSIDLLLMTYGWRKFTPKEVVQSENEKELVNYDFLKITNPGPAKKGMSDIKLFTIEGLDSISLLTNNNREAELFYDSLDIWVRQLMIIPDKNSGKNKNPVKVIFPENKFYTDNAKLLATDTSYLTSDLPLISNKQSDLDLDNVIMIEPVTIKAPKQPAKVYVDKNAKMFQYTGATTWYSKDFEYLGCFEDILYKNNQCEINWQITQDQDHQEKTVYLRQINDIVGSISVVKKDERGHITGVSSAGISAMRPALIVVDNNPIGLSYETIAQMPVSQIASVTFLRGIQGFARFGFKANGGVVFVTTKMGSGLPKESFDDNKYKRNDDLMKRVRLFRTDIEYYIPTKEEAALMPEFLFRPTILWENAVFIDGSGPVSITYPNNLVKGTAMVFVNGISSTNMVGSNRYSYKVK